MNKFDYMEKYGYEQLVYFHDKHTGLKGVTVIHDTTLGPALGGTRIWKYEKEDDAVIDCLRLARGMTYKNACAGLPLGGGKTVIIGDADVDKTEAYMRAFGRYVQSLNGRYITAADINTNTKDMNYIHFETDYVVGLEGKSGNPSPVTALGAFHGIRASLKYKFGTSKMHERTFAVQGAGQTGYFLINYLLEAGAKKVYFSEINKKYIDRMHEEHPEVEFVEPKDFFKLDVDVLAPCALGAVLNDETIPTIKAPIIAGTANNVLADEEKHGKMLKDLGIVYAPDFVINAGGVINVYHELIGYNRQRVEHDVALIYDRLLEMYKIADEQNISTQTAAKVFAENRINSVKQVRSNYIPR